MKETLFATITAIQDAVRFRLDWENRRRVEWGVEGPLIGFEKVFEAIKTLNPQILKRWIHITSSFNHGKWILDQTFPRSENPQDYSSSDAGIALHKNYVQVLGWDDKKQMVAAGASMGLDEMWIDIGFERRARERGIDLEWVFFETPRNQQSEFPSPLLIS